MSAWTSWALTLAFANGQNLTQGWSANWAQVGNAVTATSAAWNGDLAAGASTDLGLNGTHTGTNASPTAFTVNGRTCTVG